MTGSAEQRTGSPGPPSRPRRRRLLSLLAVAVSLFFLVLMARQLDARRVWSELQRLSFGRLAFALLTMFCALSMMTARSFVLFAPIRRFAPAMLFKSLLLALAGNNVLPMRMGELLRVGYLARRGNLRYSSCLAVIGVERLLDLLCMALLFFGLLQIVMVPLPRAAILVGVAAGTAGGLLVLVGIARHPTPFVNLFRAMFRLAGGERVARWIGGIIENFASGLTSLRSAWRGAAALLFSALFWSSQALTFRVFLWTFDLQLPWYAPGVVLVFVAFGVALPSSPAYVGTYHYFCQLALTLMGVERNRAASVAIVSHAASVVPITTVALMTLSHEVFRRGARDRRPPGTSGL